MAELLVASGLEQSNLSRHVAALEEAGCVERRRIGRFVRVEISDPSIADLCSLVCGALIDGAARRHALLEGA